MRKNIFLTLDEFILLGLPSYGHTFAKQNVSGVMVTNHYIHVLIGCRTQRVGVITRMWVSVG